MTLIKISHHCWHGLLSQARRERERERERKRGDVVFVVCLCRAGRNLRPRDQFYPEARVFLYKFILNSLSLDRDILLHKQTAAPVLLYLARSRIQLLREVAAK